MEYRAVGNRCAVNLDSLNLPIPEEEALAILRQKNFTSLDIDILALAREHIGVARYHRGVRIQEAPAVVDCSSFIKWLYGMRGIWLPRLSPQQREVGEEVGLNSLIAGDVVFTPGHISYGTSGVGHVGIVTEHGSIFHATKGFGIAEISLCQFTQKGSLFRGARRYIPKDTKVLTLIAPPTEVVETADDIKWIVLKSLNWRKE